MDRRYNRPNPTPSTRQTIARERPTASAVEDVFEAIAVAATGVVVTIGVHLFATQVSPGSHPAPAASIRGRYVEQVPVQKQSKYPSGQSNVVISLEREKKMKRKKP